MDKYMKTIIAGSRSISDYNLIKRILNTVNKDIGITTVVSGTANGVDKMGERWAVENHLPVEFFPADWDKYGKSAGPKRNIQMAENSDALVCIWDGSSKGSKHMYEHMASLNKLCYLFNVPKGTFTKINKG